MRIYELVFTTKTKLLLALSFLSVNSGAPICIVSLDRNGPGFIPKEDRSLEYYGPLEEKYYLLEEVWQSFEAEAIKNFVSTLLC